MIHMDERGNAEALAAFLKAHPHRDPNGRNDDHAAIEWMHGWIVGRSSR
jgi:hypothetical protein